MKYKNIKFYNYWRSKTSLEKKYIEALERALIWIKKQAFIDDVIAIYVKGSFIFREFNERSDIDVVPVMKNEKSLNLIREIRDKNKEWLKPVDILPIGIEELKKNKYYKEPLPGTKGKPDMFTILLPYNKGVYGKTLNTKEWDVRSDQKIYDNLKSVIKNSQISMFEKGEFGFSTLLKQTMHLIWWEERLKGRNFPSSWKAIKKACPNNRLLQKTVFYRYNLTKDKDLRSEYINELKKYLD